MIRILIVDDSVVIRRVLTELLSAVPDFQVVGTAANGQIALAKLAQHHVDIILLDVEMPELDGLELLRIIREGKDSIPVIMFSALTIRGAETTLRALEMGATDYFTKPSGIGGIAESKSIIQSELVPRIRMLAKSKSQTLNPLFLTPKNSRPIITDCTRKVDCVLIAASTGGPNALSAIYGAFTKPSPVPILVVQHMPPLFTRLLADRLAKLAGGLVREAQHGERVGSGSTLLAPGDFHMEVRESHGGPIVFLHQNSPENSCRPAADPLFRSAARVYGDRVLAVVLTGMGQDGTQGCAEIRDAGGSVFVQDEASSIVWGMPGAVAKAGLANEIVPLELIADRIERQVQVGRAP